ncbi:MAG TPA: hypothetical protein PKX01_10440 [Rhodocyclaceae bacterium]|uniref:Uncharacterized protein n=1 Tax=Dechloromonas agitata TaxID=73030 RepID=A0A930BQK0_9RHOO|nr:hypothetical protein [Accumulibacter sp.]MBF1163719.1 hypothetical protein [Dechloromonas agitata]HMZ76588.1 hypothetical protein [Rhodocyclaceae bacterium]HNA45534.1 hypothetical protein [Nitrospira sp.]HNC27469.1 hypothetical protein [Accumulibacter sp.]HNF61745.1 hypothetical protein [Rhodocyclaceae bacterium]
MEKVLLVMALLGSAHLAFRGVGKVGKLVIAFAAPKSGAVSSVVRMPEVRPMAVRMDGEEDWSKYDIPAFIRRGIPMPTLEPMPAKETKTRKRRSKVKAEGAATPASSDTATFEVVA